MDAAWLESLKYRSSNLRRPHGGARRSAVDRSPCKGEAPGSNPGASTGRLRVAPVLTFNPFTIESQELLRSDWESAQGLRRASSALPDDGRLHTQPGRKLS